MAAPEMAKRLRRLSGFGWSAEVTGGGHLRLRHERGGGVVILPSTPSDRRGWRNDRARLRRVMGEVGDDRWPAL